MVPQVAGPAKKLIELPRDLLDEVKRQAAEQGVSANAFIVASLAAAVGYRRPKK